MCYVIIFASFFYPYPVKIGTINGERLSFQQKTNYNLNLSKCIFQWGLNYVLNNYQFTIRFRILQYFVLMWGGVVCWPIIPNNYIYSNIFGWNPNFLYLFQIPNEDCRRLSTPARNKLYANVSLKIKVINFVFKIPNSKYKDDKNVKYLLIFFSLFNINDIIKCFSTIFGI